MRARRFDDARGFTLVELLAVIAIIVLLAGGLVVSVGYFAKRAGQSRTQSILMMVEQGIEAFHDDYGVYPPEYRDSENSRFFEDENYDVAGYNPFNKALTGIPDYKPEYRFDVRNANYDFSSEILYYFLVERFDPSQPALGDLPRKTAYVEFPEYAVKDTDDDGYMEIVDSWGNPILYVAQDLYPDLSSPELQFPNQNVEPHLDKNNNTFSLYSYGNDGLGLHMASQTGEVNYPVQHKTYDDLNEMLTEINTKYSKLSSEQTRIDRANSDNVINW